MRNNAQWGATIIFSLGLFMALGLAPATAGGPQWLEPRSKYKSNYAFNDQPQGCYLRSDVGYAFSDSPSATYDGGVGSEDIEGTHFFEGGLGCGFARKFRGEIVAAYYDERDFSGTLPSSPSDKINTEISSYTLMFNVYYDFNGRGRFKPYVGAGLGFSYNDMDDVTDTATPAIQTGDEELAFAWSVMAGFGYQITPRMVFDLGYRYIDFGKANSARSDSSSFVNPRLNVDDLSSHQIKAGIRYYLGSASHP